MTEFEVLLVPISLILGLGVAKVLGGVIHAIRTRRTAAIHWLPLTWGLSILLYNVGYFNSLYDIHQSGQPWTWAIYGSVLLQTVLLFLAAGLVFPGDSEVTPQGMLSDFEADGRLALIPLGILLATAPFSNRFIGGDPWIGLNNVFDVVLTGIIIAALVSNRRAVRSALGVAFVSLTIVGILFAWAQPGSG